MHGMSNVASSTLDLLFGKRRVVAPRSTHDVLTELPRWTVLIKMERLAHARSLLYDLAALKPSQGYTSDMRTITNTLVYLNVLRDAGPVLRSLLDPVENMSTLSVWSSPRLAERADIQIYPTTYEEELYLALYAAAAHLSFFVVDLSSYMDQEASLKACITALNAVAHIWRSLQSFIEHNEHYAMVAHSGGAANLCFSTDLLLELARAQLAEMWVVYYRRISKNSSTVGNSDMARQMMFRTALEYELIESRLPVDTDYVLAGPFPRGALRHIAAIKHQYYLAEACDQLLSLRLQTSQLQGGEEVALLVWSGAYTKAQKAVKAASQLEPSNISWQERIATMSSALATLNQQHLLLIAQLQATIAPTLSEASTDQAAHVTFTELFGEPALLRQLETAAGPTSDEGAVSANPMQFAELASALIETLNSCAIKLAPHQPLFADIPAHSRHIAEGLVRALGTPTTAPIINALPPEDVVTQFANHTQLWKALKRLGLCSERLVRYNMQRVADVNLERINSHLVSLLEMMQLIFFYAAPIPIQDLIKLGRAVATSDWGTVLAATTRTLIQAAGADMDVQPFMASLFDIQDKIHADFVTFDKLTPRVKE